MGGSSNLPNVNLDYVQTDDRPSPAANKERRSVHILCARAQLKAYAEIPGERSSESSLRDRKRTCVEMKIEQFAQLRHDLRENPNQKRREVRFLKQLKTKERL